jgi:hypothetical protein
MSVNQLESIIDGKTQAGSKEAALTQKYRRYTVLSAKAAPYVMTDSTIQEVEKVVGQETSLRSWRDRVLWPLLEESVIVGTCSGDHDRTTSHVAPEVIRSDGRKRFADLVATSTQPQ